MKDFSFHIFREVDTRFQFLRGMLTQKGTKLERLQTPPWFDQKFGDFSWGMQHQFSLRKGKIYLLTCTFIL